MFPYLEMMVTDGNEKHVEQTLSEKGNYFRESPQHLKVIDESSRLNRVIEKPDHI